LGSAWRDNQDDCRAYLDADHIDVCALAVRRRRPGDRFQPLGMGGRSKDVGDFLAGAKVPAAARPGYPLVVDGQRILWLPGLRIDERARVDSAVARVLTLVLQRV
jgi:tRNA(Ile)-lysidine synthase